MTSMTGTQSTVKALLSTEVLERHLLRLVSLPDLQSLRQISTAFTLLVAQGPDAAWRAAASNTPAYAGCSLILASSGERFRQSASARGALRSGAAAVEYASVRSPMPLLC